MRKLLFSLKLGKMGPEWAKNSVFCNFSKILSLVFPGNILKRKQYCYL